MVSIARRWGCTSLLGSCTRSCRKEKKNGGLWHDAFSLKARKKKQAGILSGERPVGFKDENR